MLKNKTKKKEGGKGENPIKQKGTQEARGGGRRKPKRRVSLAIAPGDEGRAVVKRHKWTQRKVRNFTTTVIKIMKSQGIHGREG